MIGKIQIMQAEVVFSEGDQSLLLHAAQFMGQGAAVDAQKGRQFLPGVGDGKGGLLPLGGLHGQMPSQLSGGQQQRTALARILVSNPRILLLDEPFSALDNHLRFRLEQEVRQTIADFGRTVLLVSHDRDEVFRLADSIAVVSDGSIDAVGSKAEVFHNPQTRMGAMLTGCPHGLGNEQRTMADPSHEGSRSLPAPGSAASAKRQKQ